MPRPIWTGAIGFGLVRVPVKVFAATESHTVSFHQLRRGTGERIHNKRVADGTDEEVPYRDIVKGYDLGDGNHVVVAPEELEAIEPHRSKTIDIEDFVSLEDIDPVYFQRTYYLAPADEAAARPYELLHAAMAGSSRVAIARFVMRTKEYLAAVRPTESMLVLETMHFADEVRDPAYIDEMSYLGQGPALDERELSTAERLIETLAADWEPQQYEDTYRAKVMELIEAKAAGEAFAAPGERPGGDVIDLMAALEESVAKARKRHPSAGESSAPARREREARRGATGQRASSGRRSAAKRADKLSGLSRQELYDEAKRRDIAGRSKMSKDDLIAALAKAS